MQRTDMQNNQIVNSLIKKLSNREYAMLVKIEIHFTLALYDTGKADSILFLW
jgi:hypothetical protein